MERKLSISDEEFANLRKLIFDKFGINLTEEKKQLLISRLYKVLDNYGFADFHSYYQFVLSDKKGAALDELVNKISTNYSFFYRESDHFDFFTGTFLPDLVNKLRSTNENDIRLWCAGCASGEEPYTIVMLMLDYFGRAYPSYSAGILATDISQNALDFAHKATYPQERVFKLPSSFIQHFLTQTASGEYRVNNEVRSQVVFRRFNLMNEKFPFKKKFHAIFCRNVMIYFDQKTKIDLVGRFADFLEPGGYLFVGHSESLGRGQHANLEYIMPAVYRKI